MYILLLLLLTPMQFFATVFQARFLHCLAAVARPLLKAEKDAPSALK